VLGLTWGTHKWLHVGRATLPLKTSPSGGASHSLEAYVVVRGISGLDPGVYHYNADAHALVRLKQRWSRAWLTRCLAGQDWFADANAVVFMTAVFPRVQWKYRFPRAYRTVLLEAGHFCQTFCLTATWLGLAPFCTAALADGVVEKSLEIDGVTESVLYGMGVGSRPKGATWAPWPDRAAVPRTSEPAHRRRNPGSRRSNG
jgi:SagB-type dehydrogenase family enzyme